MRITERVVVAFLSVLLVAACGEGSQESSESAPTFYVGRMTNGDAAAPVGYEYLTSWVVSYIPGQHEIYLATATTPFAEGQRDRWALTIRFDPGRVPAVLNASDVALTLFSNYKNDCCINRDDAFGSSETYTAAYSAVSGMISLQSDRQGTFDVVMQEEVTARSRNFIGPRFRLRGCWRFAGGEQGTSGCALVE